MISTILDAMVSISSRVELSLVVKATMLLAVGLTAAHLASRARASVRHLLLAATFATLLALPVFVVTAPDLTVRIPVAQPVSVTPLPGEASVQYPTTLSNRASNPATSVQRPWTQLTWSTIVRWGWIAGILMFGLPLGLAIWRLQRIRRAAVPRPELRALVGSLANDVGIRKAVEILEHEAVLTPLTCGVFRPAILLPASARDWNDPELARALVHELDHVRRFDWAVLLAARAVCACYWFHPLTWIALRRMCLEAERACDDAVLRHAERTDYADQLVLLARRLSAPHAPAMLGMANRSDLSRRVAALLDDRQARGRAGIAVAAGTLLIATLMVTTIAPLRAVSSATRNAGAAADERTNRESSSSNVSTETSTAQRRVRALDRALYEAAENGAIDEVNELLQAGANIDAVIHGDGSPLMGAVRSGRIALVRHLLDRGANVNMPVSGDGNPLIVAAGGGHADIIELLLDRGASVDQIVPGDENALIQASAQGHLEVVKLLVSRGADVNLGVWVDTVAMNRVSGESVPQRNREWRSPLSMARKNRRTAVVQFLIAAGARE